MSQLNMTDRVTGLKFPIRTGDDMAILTEIQRAQYQRDGFLAPIPAFSQKATVDLRAQIENLETAHQDPISGRPLGQFFRVNGQIVLPVLAEMAANPLITDPVSDILGPNLLVWSVELFIKEPHTESVVSWHQDLTYWGMGETNDELTAWVALSDVSVQAGAMRFIPGSHAGSIVDHRDTFDDNNLLSRGQSIDGVDEAQAVHGALKPGEMSFHHGRVFHASGPNKSDDRRIGCAIRYVTPEVEQSANGRDYAMLVRGEDAVGGWIPVPKPQTAFSRDSLALYDEILAHQTQVLAEGATENVGLYQTKEPSQ